jgi:ABC-type enterobactin transport system permease subunit
VKRISYFAASGALLILIALAFAVGRYPVSLAEIFSLLFGQGVSPNVETVVMQVRGPRVLAALLVGAALAAAGTAYQGMFRNPLVSSPRESFSSSSPRSPAGSPQWGSCTGSGPGCAATIRCSHWC